MTSFRLSWAEKQAEFGAGSICEAMYDADEALRLSGSLFASSSSAAPYEPQLLGVPGSLDELGSWKINALYLASLAQAGRLWEKIGSPTEASPLLREGAQLVAPLCLFSSNYWRHMSPPPSHTFLPTRPMQLHGTRE